MKLLAEQDHYEILEVAPSAGREQIERAYKLARDTFGEESLAGYSVLGDRDAAWLRERIEDAYRVLADPEQRDAYDAWLAERRSDPGAEAPEPPPAPAETPLPLVLDDVDESGEFNGARLRRLRLSRGMELEEIAGVTKINPNYLRCLEEERFADLPAAVYVRGFVTSFASCVGLDARRVAASYMRRYRESRAEPPRGRR